MNQNGSFRDDDWRRSGSREGGGADAGEIDHLLDLAVQAGLLASGCLAFASLAPMPLVAPLLHEFLVISAFLVSLVGLLRGESVTLKRFNRQDVALALLALAQLADLFVDPAAVEAFLEAQAASTAGVR